MNLHVICIDNQNDFCNPNGALYVKGGDENVKRMARMIERLTPKITDAHVTMDSHHILDISHPQWWIREDGTHPGPITGVTLESDGSFTFTDFLNNGAKAKGRPYIHGFRERTTDYLKQLTANGRYPHTIWPEHCLIGDEGHNLDPTLAAALHGWERKRNGITNIVTKGSNMWTEHFSAIQAEVPDPQDPSTQVNRQFINMVEVADRIVVGGEALSHCLANTLRDLIAGFSNPAYAKKVWLCTDATSSVTGFEKFGEDFIREMKAKGMNLTTTVDFLA